MRESATPRWLHNEDSRLVICVVVNCLLYYMRKVLVSRELFQPVIIHLLEIFTIQAPSNIVFMTVYIIKACLIGAFAWSIFCDRNWFWLWNPWFKEASFTFGLWPNYTNRTLWLKVGVNLVVFGKCQGYRKEPWLQCWNNESWTIVWLFSMS